jgi:hypothetical protein
MNQIAKANTQLPPEMVELLALRAENEALKAKMNAPKANGLGIKVSAKGGVSVYGLGRFPITLYSSQWTTLLAKSEEIKAFIVDNATSLKSKEA